MGSKSGQAALFVIISIVLVLLVVLVFVGQEVSQTSDLDESIKLAGTKDARTFMDSCVRKDMNEGTENILENSGYYIENYDNTISFENKTIYYFFNGSDVTTINSSFVERQIELFAYDLFDICRNEYELGNSENKVNIWLDNITVSLNEFRSDIAIDIRVESFRGDSEKKDVYRLHYPLRYRVEHLIRAASEIAEYDEENQYEHSVLVVADIANDYNFSLKMFNNNDDTIIYRLYEKNPYYEFNFATKYKSYSCADIPVDDEVLMNTMIDLCLE